MRKRIMILDAYNILHKLPAWKPALDVSLESAREQLLGYCRRWMSQRGDVWLFYVVFDGDSSVTAGQTSAGPGIRVVFSASGQAADDRILEILREFGERFDYVVVSDDRYVKTKAKLLGAEVMPAITFGRVLHAGDAPLTTTGGVRARKGKSSRHEAVEDALPPDMAKDITESLKRLWKG